MEEQISDKCWWCGQFAIFADAKHKTFFIKIINIDWFYIIIFHLHANYWRLHGPSLT
jgi:hypothetical protein